MNGIVLGLVRETLQEEYGRDVWGSILDSRSEGGDGGPSDADAADSRDGAVPSDALVCWLGRRAVTLLRERHPRLFDRHPDLRSFLRSLTGSREPSPPAGADAGIPGLACHPAPDGGVLLTVGGSRRGSRTCALLKGLVAEAAVHYGEPVDLRELKCGGRGDNRCLLHVDPVTPATRVRDRGRGSARRRTAGLA